MRIFPNYFPLLWKHHLITRTKLTATAKGINQSKNTDPTIRISTASSVHRHVKCETGPAYGKKKTTCLLLFLRELPLMCVITYSCTGVLRICALRLKVEYYCFMLQIGEEICI